MIQQRKMCNISEKVRDIKQMSTCSMRKGAITRCSDGLIRDYLKLKDMHPDQAAEFEKELDGLLELFLHNNKAEFKIKAKAILEYAYKLTEQSGHKYLRICATEQQLLLIAAWETVHGEQYFDKVVDG